MKNNEGTFEHQWKKYQEEVKQQTNNYKNDYRDIRALSLFLISLLALSVGLFISYSLDGKISEANAILTLVIALASALLICKTASRQLMFQAITAINERHQNSIKDTDYLLTIIHDIRSQLRYCQLLLDQPDKPIFIFKDNILTIHTRFEMLYEKSTLKSMSTRAKEMLSGLSGHIFGLKLHATSIQNLLQKFNNHLPIDSVPVDTRQSLSDSIGRAASDFDELYNETYNYRLKLTDLN